MIKDGYIDVITISTLEKLWSITYAHMLSEFEPLVQHDNIIFIPFFLQPT